MSTFFKCENVKRQSFHASYLVSRLLFSFNNVKVFCFWSLKKHFACIIL